MIWKNNKIVKSVILIFLLFTSVIFIITPDDQIIPSASAETVQHSGPRILGNVIYKNSTWTVNTTETYYDTIFELKAHLIIEGGGVLTLRNCTIIMNVSILAYPLWIKVKNGGTLRIWDKDNNRNTMDDASNITDSPYDTDDGLLLDYKYFFRVNENGTLDINNSIIEECGRYDSGENMNTFGLYSTSDNTIIRNSSFSRCDYGIIIHEAKNALIENVDILNSKKGMQIENSNNTLIRYCNINTSLTGTGIYVIDSGQSYFQDNNIVSDYYSLYLQNVETLYFINNYLNMTGTSYYSAIKCTNSKNITIDGLVGRCYKRMVEILSSDFINLRNIEIIGPNSTPILDYGMKIRNCFKTKIENCELRNIDGRGIDIYDYYTDNIDEIRIFNCTLVNITEDGIFANRINDLIIDNCTLQNVSVKIYNAIYLQYCEPCEISNCNITSKGDNKDIYAIYCHGISIHGNSLWGNTKTQTGIYIYYGDGGSIYDNYIYRHANEGISMYYSDNNYIYNNAFIGYDSVGYGIYLSRTENNRIENCKIMNYSYGIYNREGRHTDVENVNISIIKNSGYYSYLETNVTLENVSFYMCQNSFYTRESYSVFIKNSTFSNSNSYDVYLWLASHVTLVDCIYSPSKLRLWGVGAKLDIGWWADIYTEDARGAVPGAFVKILNKSGVKEFEGYSGSDGHVILPMIQQTHYFPISIAEIYDNNPHNVSGYLYPDTAYVVPEPSITTNDKYTITFPGNTYPAPPRNLQAESSDDDVLLTWDYPNLIDLDHFEIFRSLDTQNFNFNNPIGTPSAASRSWIDIDGASNWYTYYYCIRANDTNGQLGNASNIAQCGDWVAGAGIYQQHSNLDIDLNGSIIIESGGKLNLSNVKIEINNSIPGEHGVLVKSGGVFELTDNDNNNLTFNDASNVTASNISNPIYFIVEPNGKLFVNNSILYNIGFKGSEESYAGLYISGNGSIVRGNNIISTIYSENGFNIYSAHNVQVINNWFDWCNRYPIFMIGAQNCIIDNNFIEGTTYHGIELSEGTRYNIVSNNTIKNCYWGVGSVNARDNKLKFNTFIGNYYGIYCRYSQDIMIYNNTFSNHSNGVGLYSRSCNNIKAIKNYAFDYYIGIQIQSAQSASVISNIVDDIETTGIYVSDITNCKIMNNTISNCSTEGLRLEYIGYYRKGSEGEPVEFSNVSGVNVINCIYGLYIRRNYYVKIDGINLQQNLYGMYVEESGTVDMNSSVIKNNYGIGIYVSEFYDYYDEFDYTLLMENCTISNPGGAELRLDDGAIVWIINISIPYNNIDFRDGESKVAFFWYTQFYVEDMFYQPVSNAELIIQQSDGNFQKRKTDNDGYIRWVLLHDITSFRDGNFTSNPYTIKANYGNHSGENETNIDSPKLINVTLDNNKPFVAGLELKPKNPTTLNDLTLTFGYFDPEGDPEFPYMVKWFVNGIEEKTLANTTVINQTITTKGQNWKAKVWVSDGAAFSEPVESDIITILNTAPIVSNILLSPTTPSSTTDIQVSYSFSDTDNDLEGDTIIEWYVDSGSGYVKSTVSGPVLAWSNTKKGETWMAKVRPHDGESFGNQMESNEVMIGNSHPEIFMPMIKPEFPTSVDDLYLDYEFFDVDFDSEVEGTYKWLVDRNDGSGFIDSGITTWNVSYKDTNKGDIWSCIFTPTDGEDSGNTYNSTNNVTIYNTPPNIKGDVRIKPENPSSSSTLIIDYTYFDFDSDTEDLPKYRWYVDFGNGFEFSNRVDEQVVNEYLKKGSKWYCQVTPFDGETYGTPFQSNIVEIGNSPPSATDLQITPESPIGGESISCKYKFIDIDSDTESGTMIQWFRNSEHVSTYDFKTAVPENVTRKGEVWYFTLQPSDGEKLGNSTQSPSVIIGNSPPKVTSASITPDVPTNSDDLVSNYDFFDADDDDITEFEIKWYRNGEHFLGNWDEVKQDYTFRQDVWYFQIRVYDGSDWSEWANSPPKLIENIIPELLVTPKNPNIVINETESIAFSAVATDKDGDELIYSWYLDDQIQSDKDTYNMVTNYDSKSIYNVTIKVTDGTAEVKFEWTVKVNNINRQPFFKKKNPEKSDPKVKVGEPFEFIVTVDDPDSEDKNELKITWFLANVEVGTGEKYTYTPQDHDVGKIIVKAEVKDGDDLSAMSTTTMWNVTVGEEEVKEDRELLLGYSYDFWGLILAGVSGLIGICLFLFGVLRMRKKKDRLKEHMKEIEKINESEIPVGTKEKELLTIKKEVKKEFSSGRLVENHYLILERMLEDSLGEIRTEIVESKVSMPEKLKEDVGEVLEDGVVTRSEYSALMEKITSSKELSEEEKKKLKRQMTQWMKESKDSDELESDIKSDEVNEIVDNVDSEISEEIKDKELEELD